MIAKVTGYCASVFAPNPGGRDTRRDYQRLAEKLCLTHRDVDAVCQQLNLIISAGEQPLVTIFEPKPWGDHGQ
jgi:hypothetical protein